MSKRKSKSSGKPGALTPDVTNRAATSKRASSAYELAHSEEEELKAAPETETRVPELPDPKAKMKLPPVPPPGIESKPPLPPDLAGLKLDFATLPIGARAQAGDSARTVTAEAKMTGPFSEMDGPRRAIAGMEACQILLLEMTLNNLDFAASLTSMLSPLEILSVATKFAGRRIDIYGRFSKAVADIAAGRQAR